MLFYDVFLRKARAPNACSFPKFEIGFEILAPENPYLHVQLAYLKGINSLLIFLMFWTAVCLFVIVSILH